MVALVASSKMPIWRFASHPFTLLCRQNHIQKSTIFRVFNSGLHPFTYKDVVKTMFQNRAKCQFGGLLRTRIYSFCFLFSPRSGGLLVNTIITTTTTTTTKISAPRRLQNADFPPPLLLVYETHNECRLGKKLPDSTLAWPRGPADHTVQHQ